MPILESADTSAWQRIRLQVGAVSCCQTGWSISVLCATCRDALASCNALQLCRQANAVDCLRGG